MVKFFYFIAKETIAAKFGSPRGISGADSEPAIRFSQDHCPGNIFPSTNTNPSRKHNSALFHGIATLQIMLRYGRSLGVTEIARELGVSKSSAHDLIATLGEIGFVDKNSETRRYSLSPEIFKFLGAFTNQFGHNSRIYSLLRERAQALDVSLYVSVLYREDTYVICASGKLGDTVVIGSSSPWYSSSSGKAVVALLDENSWPDLMPKASAQPLSEHTILDHGRLREQLVKARTTGVAWNDEETQTGFHSVAAPVKIRGRPSDRGVAMVLTSADLARRERTKLEQQIRIVARDLAKALLA